MTKATIIPSLTNAAPSRSNPASFPTDGDSFLTDLPNIVSVVNTVANELTAWNAEIETLKNQSSISQTNAASSSGTALTQARNASASLVSLWVSGTTYSAGQVVYSNVDGREYKRITAGAGTTDPSSDTTNWEPLGWDYIANYPDIRPTLDLNFAGSQTVDPRITFTRNSIATYFDKFGIMQVVAINQPRIDFDPITGECKGLLIEEQRTNLLTYSSEFDNAFWTKNEVTVAANVTVAPDGSLTADKVMPSTSPIQHNLNIPNISAGTYTWSAYFKSAGYTKASITCYDGTSYKVWSIFDLSSGVVLVSAAGSTSKIESVGNGWYRCSVSATLAAASQFGGAGIGPNIGGIDASESVAGNGTSGIYLWGAQLEAGTFPTSYIPTTTAQVTRAADAAVMTGANFSSWYRADEGTVVAESTPQTGSYLYVDAHSSTTVDIVRTSHTPTSAQTGTLVAETATSSFNITGLTAPIKSAFAYKLNDFAVSANGGVVQTDTSGNLPNGVNRLTIGHNNYNPTGHCGHIKRVAYYPKRLPNATLQAITQP